MSENEELRAKVRALADIVSEVAALVADPTLRPDRSASQLQSDAYRIAQALGS